MTHLRVLYVDDESDIREVAAMSLELDEGLEVRTAPSGTAALEMLAKEDWAPGVILLDVMMPVLDGPGTLERLRRLDGHADTPVVFITARAQANEQSRFMALGAVGVITKPFDPMNLAQRLRAILAQAASS
jgi:CheY-like chemotaxis protein